MISGILPLDKPLGWTSHDVVARIRRVAGQRQVGHAGTLDPLATGLLVLVLGRATRLSSYLMHSPKTYCADVVLGASTATDDGEAPLAPRHSGPGEGRRVLSIERAEIEEALQRFVGELDQVPPAYAAIKRGGEKMYVLARRGAAPLDPEPRRVTVYDIALLDWQAPQLRLRVHCSSGTYIRALARDIGEALGAGGYLHALRRVRSGAFTIGSCRPLAALEDAPAVRCAVWPPDTAVLDWPAAVLSAEDVRAACTGRAVMLGARALGHLRLYDQRGSLVALAEGRPEGAGSRVEPFRVFHEGG